MSQVDTDAPAFGRCPENPDGETHEFEESMDELGHRRWRCKFCHRGQGELRKEMIEE